MQLILETESAIDIQRDMSTIDEPLNEKVMVNGDVEDLNVKKCNGNKENLIKNNTVSPREECTKVDNVQIFDNVTTKTFACVEETHLDIISEVLENNVCDDSDDNRAPIADSDAPIPESFDDSENHEVKINDSNKTHISEEVNEELIENNIFNSKDTNNMVPEILVTTNIVKENDIAKACGIEKISPPLNEDDNTTDKTACVSGDNITNIGDELASVEKADSYNELNNIQSSSDTSTKDTEEVIKENNIIEVNEPKEIDEETTNEICKIPNLGDDVKSKAIELSDEMDVEEVRVEPNNDPCDDVDLIDQGKSECVVSEHGANPAGLADASKETVSEAVDICRLNKEVVSAPIVENKVNVEKSKDVAEEQLKEDLVKSVPNESYAEISVDDVECVSEEVKNDTCCKFKIPMLDETVEESAIVVQDEMDVEEIKEVQEIKKPEEVTPAETCVACPTKNTSEKPVICKLSNTLDILSDDDEEPPKRESQVKEVGPKTKEIAITQQQSINIEDDDDIMLIDEDVPTETEVKKHVEKENNDKIQSPKKKSDSDTVMETGEKCNKESDDLFSNINEKESTLPTVPVVSPSMDIDIKEKPVEKEPEKVEPEKPLLPENFLLSAKKNLADMNREDLEEFCILKIVESIVDRSSLSDIKAKLKAMTQNIEEYRKKAMMLTKQNRDLQVVLKSVQEEQKKMSDVPITPLKITRSVGMQVLMTDKMTARRKTMLAQAPSSATNNTNRQHVRPTGPNPRMQKPNQTIPVPRLVPASPSIKSPNIIPMNMPSNTSGKTGPSPTPNGIKSPAQKAAEKRQHNRIQSVTVDLTDDEPPTKMSPRNSPAPPVRLVPPQNLMAPQRQPFAPAPVNSPRKVYIPISGPQNQAIRPGQTIMLKPVAGARPRGTPPQPPRVQNPVRRVTSGRHPAPLPDAMKQYQPPNWKALPPAPDLRLSKVENGIVISWKIEGYQEDSYEEIASYQLYAYQETTSPPSTTLWKKIGDVKALPLPMACTLTQFMAGFKYYFAVRAVDVKSRFGPFSLPGSILLLNKL